MSDDRLAFPYSVPPPLPSLGPGEHPAPPPTILVAEDDPVSRRVIDHCVRAWGYPVVLAQDGTNAWDLLQAPDAPNLLILDWMMPGLDGPELCRRIRRQAHTRYRYVLLLTAKDEKDDVVAGLEAGADDYLTKPFHVSELGARLRTGMRILHLEDRLMRVQEELNYRATHDSLTGLLNRPAILQFLTRELERSRRRRSQVGVLMLDLDRFKQINDLHGHQAGDAVLKEVGQRLRASLRPYDGAGRYGGEEFLIVVPDLAGDYVAAHGERLRQRIASEPVVFGSQRRSVSASVGAVVSSPAVWLSSEALLSAADTALYRAKSAGRNRVELGDAESVEAPFRSGS